MDLNEQPHGYRPYSDKLTKVTPQINNEGVFTFHTVYQLRESLALVCNRRPAYSQAGLAKENDGFMQLAM